MKAFRASLPAIVFCLAAGFFPAAAPAEPVPVLLVSAVQNGGPHLADSRGMTLYLLDGADTSAADPACTDACALLWTPVSASVVRAGSGVDTSLIGQVRRPDGSVQTTYAGRPLYYFAEDTQAGETNGHHFSEFGARGYLVTPKGTEYGGQVAGDVYARDEACGCSDGLLRQVRISEAPAMPGNRG